MKPPDMSILEYIANKSCYFGLSACFSKYYSCTTFYGPTAICLNFAGGCRGCTLNGQQQSSCLLGWLDLSRLTPFSGRGCVMVAWAPATTTTWCKLKNYPGGLCRAGLRRKTRIALKVKSDIPNSTLPPKTQRFAHKNRQSRKKERKGLPLTIFRGGKQLVLGSVQYLL